MSDRIRLVVMGGSCVGKSAIVKRFLFGDFPTKHVATIEDLFSRDFELGEQAGGSGKPNVLKVDILDTAGAYEFPPMRRLSIASAHAFLLVFSGTDPLSFATVRQRFEEIREQRADFQNIPIIIARNKNDMVNKVEQDDIDQWIDSELPKQRTRLLECSARTTHNIKEVFKTFLFLSKITTGVNESTSSSRRASRLNNTLTSQDTTISDLTLCKSSPSRNPRWGSMKSPSSSPNSQKRSLLRRRSTISMQIHKSLLCRRSTMLNIIGENDEQNDRETKIRSDSNPRNKVNGIDCNPLKVPNEQESIKSTSQPTSPKRKSSITKLLNFKLNSPFSSPTGSPSHSAKSGPTAYLLTGNIEKLNTGGCGVDPTYSKGRNSKRSRSLIRRSSKQLINQVPTVTNTEDCTIS